MSLVLLVKGQAEYFREKGYTYYLASGPSEHEVTDPYYTELPLVRRPHIWKDLKALVATYRWLRTIKPDILHTHTPKAGLIGMLAGWLARVPVRLHTVAGIPWMESEGMSRKLFRFMEWLTYKAATRVYPNSHGLHAFLKEEIPSQTHKMKVLGNGSSNGIDASHFSPEAVGESKASLLASYGVAPSHLVWLFIGRVVKDKGIGELIEAFTALGEGHSLLLVGPFEDDQDPISTDIRQIIDSHPHIHTFGFQSDVRPFIVASDVLVFPSYREGFPNVPMQAGAMGLPIIATDINGCNEIVTHEVNGLLVPAKDAQALQEAMQRLAEDEALRTSLARSARSSIVERFARDRIWEKMGEEYEGNVECKM